MSLGNKGEAIAILKSKDTKLDKKFIKVSTDHDGSPELNYTGDTKLQVLPSINVTERLYIAGPSGSGKSYYISKWLGMNRKIYKNKNKKDIYIFSRIQKDHALDKFNPIRPDIEDLVEEPMRGEDLVNSICIFDDIDSISDKVVKQAVYDLQTDLLTTGRHFHITVICTSHLIMNSNETKFAVNEATSVTFFPRSGQTYQIKRFLKEYCGCEKHIIDKIMKLPSRWVTYRRVYPPVFIHEKGAFMAYQE